MARLYNLLLAIVLLLIWNPQWTQGIKMESSEEGNTKIKLDAIIHRFHFRNGTKSVSGLPTDNISVGKPDVTINPRGGTFIYFLQRTAKIYEIVDFQIAAPFTKMHSTEANKTIQFTYESPMQVVSKPNVQKKLGLFYKCNKKDDDMAARNITITNLNKVWVVHSVGVIPRSTCAARLFVKKVGNFPALYTAFAMVSAAKGTPPLSTDKLRKQLPEGMKYIKDVDKHTVEVCVEGNMYLAFASDSFVRVKCHPNRDPEVSLSDKAVSSTEYDQIYNATFGVMTTNIDKVSEGPSTIFSFGRDTFGLLVNHFG